jgi:hypothetical protein
LVVIYLRGSHVFPLSLKRSKIDSILVLSGFGLNLYLLASVIMLKRVDDVLRCLLELDLPHFDDLAADNPSYLVLESLVYLYLSPRQKQISHFVEQVLTSISIVEVASQF